MRSKTGKSAKLGSFWDAVWRVFKGQDLKNREKTQILPSAGKIYFFSSPRISSLDPQIESRVGTREAKNRVKKCPDQILVNLTPIFTLLDPQNELFLGQKSGFPFPSGDSGHDFRFSWSEKPISRVGRSKMHFFPTFPYSGPYKRVKNHQIWSFLSCFSHFFMQKSHIFHLFHDLSGHISHLAV